MALYAAGIPSPWTRGAHSGRSSTGNTKCGNEASRYRGSGDTGDGKRHEDSWNRNGRQGRRARDSERSGGWRRGKGR
eukprot:2513827-Pleurochrysis_carterae.AAC.1